MNNAFMWQEYIGEFMFPLADGNKERLNALRNLGIDSHQVFTQLLLDSIQNVENGLIEYETYGVESYKCQLSKGTYKSQFLDELEEESQRLFSQSHDYSDMEVTKLERYMKRWNRSNSASFLAWINRCHSRYQERFRELAENYTNEHTEKKLDNFYWIEKNVLEEVGFLFCKKRTKKNKVVFSKELDDEFELVFIFYDNDTIGYFGTNIDSHFIISKRNISQFQRSGPTTDFLAYNLCSFFGVLPNPFGTLYSYYTDLEQSNYMLYVHACMVRLVTNDIDITQLLKKLHSFQ